MSRLQSNSRRWAFLAVVSSFVFAQAVTADTTSPAPIDDYTEYTYAVRAAGIGSVAPYQVQRTFSAAIKTIKVTIVSGQADDIGYVGNLLVTNILPSCAGVGSVVAPVDVTSQVTVSGNTASFVLKAVENCCCWTGWGSATQGDRQNARFHWEVTFDTGCKTTVQRFSQGGSAPWANDLYDHSSTLTIRQRGCALTDLAMALSFAGQPFDPGQLNTFMKETDNDFNGRSVNWDAATRDASAGRLKFFGTRSRSTDTLKEMMCKDDGHPVIVGVNLDADGVPGHFVLVTGQENGQFLINDPGHAGRTTLDAYGNDFETRGYVADPPGDISALDISAGDGVELRVSDPAGDQTGFDAATDSTVEAIPSSVYFKDRLDDDVTGEPATETGHICQVQRPPQGIYEVDVNGLSLGTFELSVRVFSQDGSAQPPIVMPGIRGAGSVTTFQLQVTTPPGSTSTIERLATFESTLADIANSGQIGLIDNNGITMSLIAKVQAAADAARRGDLTASANMLNAFSNEVRAQSGKHVDSFCADVFLDDAGSLVRQLNR